MSGRNPLGNGREPQSYEGINVIVPTGGWQLIKSTGTNARSPTSNDKKYPVGSMWVNTGNNTVWVLTSVSGGSATWTETDNAGGSGVFTSLTVVGTSTLTGTTNINTTGAAVTSIGTGGTGATNIGNATGNTAVTGSLTASTGLVATAGGIAATGTSTINTSGAGVTSIGTGGTGTVNLGNATGDITLGAGVDFILDTATGTKFGTGASQKLGFYGTTPVIQQTQGALTNSVTAGGSTGVIADYTDLTVYANDAAAIRNDIYQLSLALSGTITALRAQGLIA